MNNSDTIQRFIFDKAHIRGEIAHLNDTYTAIINQRPYPAMVRHLLGEALISCLLLTHSIKFEGELSLQFQGDGRLPLLLIQCDHQLHLRGFAKYQENLTDNDYADAFLQGKMVLTINQYNSTQTYQSIVPIQSTAMSENLMHYFSQSEQISTRVWLAVEQDQAAGILLQLMPEQDTQHREQFWEYAVHIGNTITEKELLSLSNEDFLFRLYHETELRLFDSRRVCFQCRCTPEKMKQILTVLGKEEVDKLLQVQEKIDVCCEFCNQHYAFDAIDVAMLFIKK